jgi:hypothetical protein
VQVTANLLGTITEAAALHARHHRHRHPPGADAAADPQTISVITRAQMDDFGLHGIDDVMRVTPASASSPTTASAPSTTRVASRAELPVRRHPDVA